MPGGLIPIGGMPSGAPICRMTQRVREACRVSCHSSLLRISDLQEAMLSKSHSDSIAHFARIACSGKVLHDLAVDQFLRLGLLKLHVVVAHICFVLVACVMLFPHNRLHTAYGCACRHKMSFE